MKETGNDSSKCVMIVVSYITNKHWLIKPQKSIKNIEEL